MIGTRIDIIALAFCFLSISICWCAPNEPWVSEVQVYKCRSVDLETAFCYVRFDREKGPIYHRIFNVTAKMLAENQIKQFCSDAKGNGGKTVKRCRLFAPRDFPKSINVDPQTGQEICPRNTFGGPEYDNRTIEGSECIVDKAGMAPGSAGIVNCLVENDKLCYYLSVPRTNPLYHRVENRDINETPTGYYFVEDTGLMRRVEDTQNKIVASQCLTDVSPPDFEKDDFCRLPEKLGSMSMIRNEESTTKWHSEMKVHACDSECYVEYDSEFYRLTQKGGAVTRYFQVCSKKPNAKNQPVWRCRLLSDRSFEKMNKRVKVHKRSVQPHTSAPKGFFFTKANGEMGRVDDVKTLIHENCSQVYYDDPEKPLKMKDLSLCKQKKELGMFPTWENEHLDRKVSE
ncbi:hypothetical protein DdX_09993 [Ditylenchus destructor]|uniref:Uncharacterized protein n=1 Tax=Ditylenchus destructor TaxID=166010 RepID=A0AAD4N1K0_9BILA|nr:hypothetical protein DdX_09993 [Ditylenchus destructor]